MHASESGKRTVLLRLNDMIAQLREGIHNGTYRPGTCLPPEKALAKQFGLSNNTVRKGLDQLCAERLIEKIPRVGSVVIGATPASPAVSVSDSRQVHLFLGSYRLVQREMLPRSLIEEFHRQHPSIRVQLVPLNPHHQYLETLSPFLDTGMIDVFATSDQHFRLLMESGFAPHLGAQPAVPHLYPFLADLFRFRGESYAQPLLFSPLVLAYNLRHFREAGLPEPDASWTWQDAIDSATRLSQPGKRYGLHFQVNHDDRWPLFLLQGDLEEETGDRSDDARAKQWLEGARTCKAIVRNGDIFPHSLYGNDGDVAGLFLEGKTSMIVTAYESLNRFVGSRLEYDISSLPYTRKPATLVNAVALAVNAKSRHRAEAQLLIDYLTSASAQTRMREQSLSIPSLMPTADAFDAKPSELNRPSRYMLYRDTLTSFRTFSDLGLPASMLRPLHDALKKFWADLIDERALFEQLKTIAALRPAKETPSPLRQTLSGAESQHI